MTIVDIKGDSGAIDLAFHFVELMHRQNYLLKQQRTFQAFLDGPQNVLDSQQLNQECRLLHKKDPVLAQLILKLLQSKLQQLDVSRLFTPEFCTILDSATPDALHSDAERLKKPVYVGSQLFPELGERETIVTSSREQARDPSATKGGMPFIRITTEDTLPSHKPFIWEYRGTFDQLLALVDTAVNRLTVLASTSASPDDLKKSYRAGREREEAERPGAQPSLLDRIGAPQY